MFRGSPTPSHQRGVSLTRTDRFGLGGGGGRLKETGGKAEQKVKTGIFTMTIREKQYAKDVEVESLNRGLKMSMILYVSFKRMEVAEKLPHLWHKLWVGPCEPCCKLQAGRSN